jgi:hypothetical protein
MLARIAALLGFKPVPPSVEDGYFYFDRGPTVPTDGTAGYGVGAIFQHTDGGSATAFYVNRGSATSCDFDPLLVAGTATIATAYLADDAVTAAKVADGAIDAAAKIVGGVVAPTKLVGTGMKAGHFAGRNGAGVCTLTGAAVGDRVLVGWKSGDVSDHNTAGEGAATVLSSFVALFEATITVADQIQQASATDLSDNKYTVLLIPAAA